MPPKPEATPGSAPGTPNPKEAAAAAAPAVAESGSKSLMGTLVPVILVVILAPLASWAVAQFLIIPQMEKKLNAAIGASGVPGEKVPMMVESEKGGGGHGGASKKADGGPSNTYEFNNVVVNLSGTMGTRYLKTSFIVTSKEPALREIFVGNKPKMVDVTLNVLSSLSLADLEEAGAKNIIREKLINAYNQALGKKIAEQIYFSDFVVQ